MVTEHLASVVESHGPKIESRWARSRSFRGALLGDRQRKSKRCPALTLVLRPEPTVVCLDDGARDRQPHAHPLGFGGEKGIENGNPGV